MEWPCGDLLRGPVERFSTLLAALGLGVWLQQSGARIAYMQAPLERANAEVG